MPSELKYPEGPDDHEAILFYANQAHRAARSYRIEVERATQRNVLYFLGVQWIKYDHAIRLWRPIAVGKRTPRPMTNRVASLVNTAVSQLLSNKPPITYSPATDRPEDIAAAGVADRINSIIEREAEIEYLKPLIARWLIVTGNVFLINNFDTGPDSDTDFVPAEQCLNCQAVSMPLDIVNNQGACPSCGVRNQFQPASQQAGALPGPGMTTNQQGLHGIEYPKGRFCTEVENNFTCFFDNSAGQDIYDSPYFLVARHRNKDWVTRMYGEEIAENVSYNQPTEPYTGLFESLAYATTLWSYGYGTPSALSEPRTRVRRLWLRPRPGTAPRGIYAEIVDEKVVKSGEWPYQDDTGKPMLNVVHVGWDEVPGRLLAKSRVDDIIPKQDQRNRLESIMELHAIRMANAVWLIPEGTGVSKITGEQGQIIRYNAMNGVPPPQRVPGDAVSPYIMEWMTRIDGEMDSIFGQFEVGRGETPYKGAPYAAIQLLDERQQQAQSGIMRNWANGWAEWSRQNLAIWRQYATDDRYVSTGQGQWSIQKFNKAALTGGVNITVEFGQFRPQTFIGRRALIEQAVRLGFFNVQDPQEAYQALQAMGIPELMPDIKADMEHTSRVIDALVQGGTPPPPQPWENHPLAISVFRKFMLGEAFEALPPPIQQRIVAYAGLHFVFMQQAAMTRQRGPGQVAPGPGGGGSKGAAAPGQGQSLGTDQGQLNRAQQMPTHPQMAGRP